MIIEIIILLETTLLLFSVGVLLFQTKEKFSRNTRLKIFVDTSVLIDRRILKVAQTGFLLGVDLVIPRSVVRELQLLADGKDARKRKLARSGLEIVNALERVENCNAYLFADATDHTPVDERLIELAKTARGALLTNDFNLNRTALTEKIPVLNINALAKVLESAYFPGKIITVTIARPGEGKDQGVAELDDGVMVVVARAAHQVGEKISVEITRYLQTDSGRMAFAKKTSRAPKS